MDTTHQEALLIRREAMRTKPYRCTAGKLTIGVGRNLESKGVNEAEALFMLRNDIADASQGVLRAIPWALDIGRVRRAVFVNMAFNLGLSGFLRFKKMLAAAEAGYYPVAAVEMLDSRWAHQVGARADELARMMETGAWPPWLVRKFAGPGRDSS